MNLRNIKRIVALLMIVALVICIMPKSGIYAAETSSQAGSTSSTGGVELDSSGCGKIVEKSTVNNSFTVTTYLHADNNGVEWRKK